MHPPHVSTVTAVLAFILAVLASARFTRLVVADDWPPVEWLRFRYRKAVGFGDWEELVKCPFCFAPWAVLVDLAWAWWSGLDGYSSVWAALWWAANLWFSGAYLAAMTVTRDEPPAE